MAFTEKQVHHNGRTIVWYRKNGVSILACEKLHQFYQEHEDWPRDWQRPGEFREYTGDEHIVACKITGEIIPAKRIRSRSANPKKVRFWI